MKVVLCLTGLLFVLQGLHVTLGQAICGVITDAIKDNGIDNVSCDCSGRAFPLPVSLSLDCKVKESRCLDTVSNTMCDEPKLSADFSNGEKGKITLTFLRDNLFPGVEFDGKKPKKVRIKFITPSVSFSLTDDEKDLEKKGEKLTDIKSCEAAVGKFKKDENICNSCEMCPDGKSFKIDCTNRSYKLKGGGTLQFPPTTGCIQVK